MGRRNGRRNGGRGRNRGSVYARPIPEPCNFVELDTTIVAGANLTLGGVFSLLTAVIPATSISKFRVSSIVIDPADGVPGNGLTEVTMGVSGNHYQAKSAIVPLKMRLGKDFGDDGQWFITGQGSSIPSGSGFAAADPFITVEALSNVTTQPTMELHIRYAWQDPS